MLSSKLSFFTRLSLIAFAAGCGTSRKVYPVGPGYRGLDTITISVAARGPKFAAADVHDRFLRIMGVKSVAVKADSGRIVLDLDPAAPVLPSEIWGKAQHLELHPERLELWCHGKVETGAFIVDGGRWPLASPGPPSREPIRARLLVLDGAQDPPQVRILD